MNFVDLEAKYDSDLETESEDENLHHVQAREESECESETSDRGIKRLHVQHPSYDEHGEAGTSGLSQHSGLGAPESSEIDPTNCLRERNESDANIPVEETDFDAEIENAFEGIGKRIDKEKKRVCAVRVLLTYPALGNIKPNLESYRKFFEQLGGCGGIISVERHKSGSYHVHALIEKATKWDCSMRFFDFNGKHPNIRTVLPGKLEGAEEYVCKDGDYLKWNQREVPASSKNYLKRKADKECWLRDVRASRFCKDVGRIALPDGQSSIIPHERSKKRGVVIVGEPDLGKTSWLLHELRGTRYYQVSNERNPWDCYDGSRVIVWNDADFWPTKGELTFFTDLGLPYHRGGYLRARFFDKFVEPGNYTLIILCNRDKWEPCPYRYEQWFLSRFTVTNLTNSWSCTDENCNDCPYKRNI